MVSFLPIFVSHIFFNSVMTLSAHSSKETKMVGLPNFAFQGARSQSVTPRARLHIPQA
jgi:hypothetical protein